MKNQNKIRVNAILDSDNIRIVAVSNSWNNNIVLIHDEKINSLNTNKSEIKNAIKNAIKNIEKKLSIKIKSINIIFNDFMKRSDLLDVKTKIIETGWITYNKSLLSNDYKKIISLMINNLKSKEENYELISIVPFNFFYFEYGSNKQNNSDWYVFDKKIKKINIIFSVRYMKKESYKKTIEFFDFLNLKIDNVILKSQLEIYNYDNLNNDYKNKDFVISIQENNTMLIHSENNYVIKTDVLDYSFKNLIIKISNDFGISYNEAENLIYSYCHLNNQKKEEIIYSSSQRSSNETSKPITNKDITNIIKSFLKSICTQANNLISSRINKNNENVNLKIMGQLSKLNDISNYCSKYFDLVNIIELNYDDNIYSWNKSFENINQYWKYVDVINKKLISESFYRNEYEISNFNQNNLKNKNIVKSVNSSNVKTLMA